MGGGSEGEEDNFHNMKVNDNVFFDLEVSSIVMKNHNIHFLMKFLPLLIFESYLQLFIGIIRESKRVSGAACEFVVGQLGKLLNFEFVSVQ